MKNIQVSQDAAFAVKISFETNPHENDPVDPDIGLSWGSFQIWVDGKNLCAHSEEGEVVDGVHWYMLPLIEWIVENWDALLHEERLPNRNAESVAWSSLRATRFPPFAVEQDEEQSSIWEEAWAKWRSRHCLRACREGGIYPDVVIRRWRDAIEVSWGTAPLSGMPEHYRFLSWTGVSRVAPEAVAETLFQVVHGAVSYLRSLSPGSQRLAELERKVNLLSSRKRDERLMWLAGIGIDQDSMAAGWRRIKDHFAGMEENTCGALFEPEQNELVVTGSCHGALMFGSVSPQITDSDVMALARKLIDLTSAHGDPEQLRSFTRPKPVDPMENAWEQGYRLAEGFLGQLGLPVAGDFFIDVKSIINKLGIECDQIHLTDMSIRGVSIAGARHRASILINSGHDANQFPSGRRFTLAHELCHILCDREFGRPLALASGPWAPRDIERRANAFAAMLLMPTMLVETAVRQLDAPLESIEVVSKLAKRFKTGVDATLQHLFNLGYLDESVKERITRAAEREAISLEEPEL
jgi:Zn-dependent peptidase ImmA (M78 family)